MNRSYVQDLVNGAEPFMFSEEIEKIRILIRLLKFYQKYSLHHQALRTSNRILSLLHHVNSRK